MPTDTIYGMVGRAQEEFVVNRIYTIRKRNPTKPCIILIGDISELEKFSVILTEEQKNKIKEYFLCFDNILFPSGLTSVICKLYQANPE